MIKKGVRSLHLRFMSVKSRTTKSCADFSFWATTFFANEPHNSHGEFLREEDEAEAQTFGLRPSSDFGFK